MQHTKIQDIINNITLKTRKDQIEKKKKIKSTNIYGKETKHKRQQKQANIAKIIDKHRITIYYIHN